MEKSLTAFFLGMVILVSGCGGSGDDGFVATDENSLIKPAKGSFIGAVTPGDFAKFSFDGENLSYQIEGPIYGNLTETVKVKVWHQEPFYYNDEQNIYSMFLGDIAVISAKINNKSSLIVGLSESQIESPEDVSGDYVIAGFSLSGEQVEISKISINSDGNWSLYNDKGEEINYGTWQFSEDKNYLIANGISGVLNIVITPGEKKGIIVDFGDGSDVALGQQSFPLTMDDVVGNYTYYFHSGNLECIGFVSVDNSGTIYFEDKWCSDGLPEVGSGKVLKLNETCDGTPVNGVLCAKAVGNYQTYTYDVVINNKDGYYIATMPGIVEIGVVQK